MCLNVNLIGLVVDKSMCFNVDLVGLVAANYQAYGVLSETCWALPGAMVFSVIARPGY